MTSRVDTEPLVIAFFIPGFGDGGAQVQCARLIKALGVTQSVRVVVIYRYRGPHWTELEGANFVARRLPTSSNYSPLTILHLVRILREERANVLLSWLVSSDIWSALVRVSRLVGTRWILCERDSQFPRSLAFSIRRFLGRSADGIIANSAAGIQYWDNAGYVGPKRVTGNIAPPATRPSSRRTKQYDILFVGRLEEQKNVLAVLECLIEATKLDPAIRSGIVGQGSLAEKLKIRIREAGCSGSISLLGFRDDVATLLAETTVLLTLSHHEGLPNVLIEGVANECNVVASAIAEHRAILGDAYPYLVHEEDTRETAELVLRALRDTTRGHLDFARAQARGMSPRAIADDYLNFVARNTPGT